MEKENPTWLGPINHTLLLVRGVIAVRDKPPNSVLSI